VRLVLTGATGFVGSEVLLQALADPVITQVIVLTRRSLSRTHEKLSEVVLQDFTDYRTVPANELRADACIWCLGVSQTEVSRDEYVRVTHDYAVAAAKAMLAVNSALRFCFLSGARADQQERSRVYYGRIKGRTEHALDALTPNAYHFRPAMIREPGGATRPPLVARMFVPLALLLDRFTDGASVECRELASHLLDVAKNGGRRHIFDNAAIRYWRSH